VLPRRRIAAAMRYQIKHDSGATPFESENSFEMRPFLRQNPRSLWILNSGIRIPQSEFK